MPSTPPPTPRKQLRELCIEAATAQQKMTQDAVSEDAVTKLTATVGTYKDRLRDVLASIPEPRGATIRSAVHSPTNNGVPTKEAVKSHVVQGLKKIHTTPGIEIHQIVVALIVDHTHRFLRARNALEDNPLWGTAAPPSGEVVADEVIVVFEEGEDADVTLEKITEEELAHFPESESGIGESASAAGSRNPYGTLTGKDAEQFFIDKGRLNRKKPIQGIMARIKAIFVQ